MKIAFIENRYKTYFWDAVAAEMLQMGHEVVWLVQNPLFLPTSGRSYLIPFPKSFQNSTEKLSDLDFIRHADRNINYFGGSDSHYHHYQQEINNWLDSERPDLIIGESTLFHELMVIVWCQNHSCLFLHPSMPGYPGGRYSLYAGNTKVPVGNNPNVPTDEECLKLAEAIRKRERIPDYMQPLPLKDPSRKLPRPGTLRNKFSILIGYLRGERFNTPSPLRKWILDYQVRQRLDHWKLLAQKKPTVSLNSRTVLYPLQMQPEANIDVWGQAYQNQAKLVKELADSLPEGWHLRVKANPKAKYELTEELLEALSNNPKIYPVPLEISMAEVMNETDLVCTVTGTVAVECFLSGIPLAQLGPGIVGDGAGCIQMRSPGDIATVAELVEQGKFTTANDFQRVELVRLLYTTTFPGKISDPMNLPIVLDQLNVNTVARTIVEVAISCD